MEIKSMRNLNSLRNHMQIKKNENILIELRNLLNEIFL